MTSKQPKPSDRLYQVRQLIQNIESGKNTKLIRDYQEYQTMSQESQAMLLSDWNRYYDLVWESKAKKRLDAMRKKFNEIRSNYQFHRPITDPKLDEKVMLIKQFAAKATEQIENEDWEVPMPYGRDPVEYDNNQLVLYYRQLKAEVKQLEETVKQEEKGYASYSF